VDHQRGQEVASRPPGQLLAGDPLLPDRGARRPVRTSGERCCGERTREGGQVGRVAGRRYSVRQHHQDREDAQGEARDRPRGEDRIQHSQRGKVQVQLHAQTKVLRVDESSTRPTSCPSPPSRSAIDRGLGRCSEVITTPRAGLYRLVP